MIPARFENRRRLRVAGLMTGTSMDGLDIAVCDIEAEPIGVELIAGATVALPEQLRAAIRNAFTGDVQTIARLDIELGRFYAEALTAFCTERQLALDAVGCHGQTIYHEHGKTTLQIGEPGFLAAALGCPVIADFRRADIVAGGSGAPLVPVFDIAMFARDDAGVVALNIGGIANITAIPDLERRERAMAFDTGPGNMVVDGLVQRMTQGRERFDPSGDYGTNGSIDRELLGRWLAHPFFRKSPPRSTGREEFGDGFCDAVVAETKPATLSDWNRLIATATALTAESIMQAIRDHVLPEFPISHLLIGGGGVHNRFLCQLLAQSSNRMTIQPMSDVGVDPDMREAMAFAFLAERHLRGLPGNLPRATGATQRVTLGKTVQVAFR